MDDVDVKKVIIKEMDVIVDLFYTSTMRIGHRPFMEFAGLMKEYVKICRVADSQGIDYVTTEKLPIRPDQLSYINEKLVGIFRGATVLQLEDDRAGSDAGATDKS